MNIGPYQLPSLAAISLACLASLAGGAASAQDGGRDARYQRDDQRGEQRGDQHYRHADEGHRARCDYARPWVHERNHRSHRRVGGAGPCHDIFRGEPLPRYYAHARYRVGDWQRYQLATPWRAHHWVQTGNDFVMVQDDTGMISRVVLMRHRRN